MSFICAGMRILLPLDRAKIKQLRPSSSMLYCYYHCFFSFCLELLVMKCNVKCCPMCLTLFPTVQQCPDPGEVVNGARSVRPEAGFAVGTVVRFSCNQGYQLEGPSQISCHGRDTGTPKWSDRSPKCVCKSCTLLLFVYDAFWCKFRTDLQIHDCPLCVFVCPEQ